MPWTPLDAALGETGNHLAFHLVQRACDERLSERAELDWKRDLSLTAGKGEPGKRLRLAPRTARGQPDTPNDPESSIGRVVNGGR